MSGRKEGLKESLAALFVGIATIPFAAYVYASGWEWFVVPLGAPVIGAAHAYGIAVLFALPMSTLLVRSILSGKGERSSDNGSLVLAFVSLFVILLCWGTMAIAHALMP